MKKFQEYWDLFFVFFRIGAVTFGGGLAMLPILERELVTRRRWMSAEQLIDYYAIGQSTPGIIAVNVATFVGYQRRRTLGALVTTVGIVLPSIIVICLVAGFLSTFADHPLVQSALRGINVAVAVLLLVAVSRVASKTIIDWITALLALAAFVFIVVWNTPGVLVVVFSALLGFVLRYRRECTMDDPT